VVRIERKFFSFAETAITKNSTLILQNLETSFFLLLYLVTLIIQADINISYY